MNHLLTRLGLGAALSIVAGVGPAAADVSFTDSTMALADYAASANYSSDSSASLSYSNPDASTLQFTSTFTQVGNPPVYTLGQGLTNNTFLYNPTVQGAISSIDASVLKNAITTFTVTGFTNTFRPTILQDGVYYVDMVGIIGALYNGPNNPGGTGFMSFSQTHLMASDFVSFNFATGAYGSANPNFDGDSMLFGLTQITGIGLDQTGTLLTQYQDLGFDIHTAAVVPEPATLTLFVLGLAGLGFSRRKQ